MERIIDLHMHSRASDGGMSPRELVRYAKYKGLSAIAITDHDTVDGIEDALDEAEQIDFEVVPGIEISADFDPEMHILGYFFGQSYLNIKSILDELKKNREERNPKIINKLNEMGFKISMEEVMREAGESIIGRPHIAKVMMKKGYVDSVREAFDKYLASGKPAYFKKDKLTPEEGIREIAKAGGIPALAHPIFLDMNLNRLDELLSKLVPEGLKGIEAYYVDNSHEDTGNLLRLAIKHNLLATGGSDFHGSFKPDIEIGTGYGNLYVPYELLEKMKEYNKKILKSNRYR